MTQTFTTPETYQTLITCPVGFEHVLHQELLDLKTYSGQHKVHMGQGQIKTALDLKQLYRICMRSRIANRVLVLRFECPHLQGSEQLKELYECAMQHPWEREFPVTASLKIESSEKGNSTHSLRRLVLSLKDGVVDRFRQHTDTRPNISEQPDIRLHLHRGKEWLSVYLDISGEALFKRLDDPFERHDAPLKANLAAAILLRSGWQHVRQQATFIDPLCGSGTLLWEAGWIYTDRAPGLTRSHWGFTEWKHHRPAMWKQEQSEAQQIFEDRAAKAKDLALIGGDQSSLAIGICRANLKRAGLTGSVQRQDAYTHLNTIIDKLSQNQDSSTQVYWVSNLPYGVRVGNNAAEQMLLHARLGEAGHRLFDIQPNTQIHWLVGDESLGLASGLAAHRTHRVLNGSQQALLLHCKPRKQHQQLDAEDLAARLKKRAKKIQPKHRQEETDAYRVYDKDLPEYRASLDRYAEHWLLTEFAPPKDISLQRALRRRVQMVHTIQRQFDIPEGHLHLQLRHAGQQAAEAWRQKSPISLQVREHGLVFDCILGGHLDTGIYLDHAQMRKWIRKDGQGQHILNLFAYTATFGVAAAAAGARTVNVDLSKTFLSRAKQNYTNNNIGLSKHRFVHADCLDYLTSCKQKFDTIFLDPPTFSNSKRSAQDLDIQRDHSVYLERCLQLLNPAGKLYFSNHAKRFKLDAQWQQHRPVDLTERSTPLGFRGKPHHLWLFEKG